MKNPQASASNNWKCDTNVWTKEINRKESLGFSTSRYYICRMYDGTHGAAGYAITNHVWEKCHTQYSVQSKLTADENV